MWAVQNKSPQESYSIRERPINGIMKYNHNKMEIILASTVMR